MNSFRTFLLRLALGLALPACALAAPGDNPAKPAEVIYPRSPAGEPAAAAAVAPGGGMNVGLLVFAAAAAAAGGWLLWRQRRSPSGLTGREARKLAVTESRSLGNRQYLVVADYNGRKFLLGVCPGRIDLLSPLGAAEEKVS